MAEVPRHGQVKTYFLVPGWDFPVGSIQLGAVITMRSRTEDDLVPIDATHLSDEYDFGSTIDKSRTTPELPSQAYAIVKDNYIEERGREKYGSKGSWRLFLTRLGVEVHIDTNMEVTIFVTKRLETSFFSANPRIS